MKTLETKRLLLRKFTDDDFSDELIYAILKDEWDVWSVI